MDDKIVSTMDEEVQQEVVEKTPEVEEKDEKKDRNSEQLEKLAKSNKELKEERDHYRNLSEAYQQPVNQAPSANQFSNLDQQQVNDVFASMIDENGFLDGVKLNSVLNDLNGRASQAEQRAQRAEEMAQRTTQTFQEREEKAAQAKVYEKYPQLNPDNVETFDPKMFDAVYNMLAVKAKAGEYPTEKDYFDAADKIYGDFYADKDMNKQEKQQKEEKEVEKKQINSIKPVSTLQAGYYADDDEGELMRKIGQGKRGAIAELLNRRGQ